VSKESGYAVALTQSSGVQLLKYRTNKTDTAPVAAAAAPLKLNFV
jgi:hypothetical protein